MEKEKEKTLKIMKHWTETDITETQYYRDEEATHGIILNSKEERSARRILSVAKRVNGTFNFMEECDNCFYSDYTKKEALELIEELKQWIIKN